MTYETRFWLELREPGKVPCRKGSFATRDTAKVLREFMEARPTAFISVVTIDSRGEPHFEDGPECLEMCDGRAASLASRHRASSAAAFAGASHGELTAGSK
jgi:hypothetical protein